MKSKIFGMLLMFLISVLALTTIASAQIDESSITVYLDNIELPEGDPDPLTGSFAVLDRGETLPLKITFNANESTDRYVEIEVEIKGDSRDDVIAAESEVFDLTVGGRYIERLDLRLTKRMEPGIYDIILTIHGTTRDISIMRYYAILVETPEHLIDIDDVIFSPAGKIKAGRALLTTVRVENNGDRNEDGVKVEVSIPELGISAADYIDELEPEGEDDDQTTSEELYMRIPDCAEAGDYTVQIDVTYDDGDEVASTTRTIEVIPNEACELDTVVPTTQPEAGPSTIIKVQDVSTGEGAGAYQVTITNAGSSTRAYTVSVNGGNQLDASIQPSNTILVNAGDADSVLVFLSAKQGVPAGQYGFSLSVSSGDSVLKQIPLTANVAGTSASGVAGSSLKRGLEIGLVVLVVLLVILGLIIGFNKLKGDEDEDAEGTQTYY
ncbi:MAG: FixG Ig-like domain-containing protein [Candidatus Woesearchaeota archaeon]